MDKRKRSSSGDAAASPEERSKKSRKDKTVLASDSSSDSDSDSSSAAKVAKVSKSKSKSKSKDSKTEKSNKTSRKNKKRSSSSDSSSSSSSSSSSDDSDSDDKVGELPSSKNGNGKIATPQKSSLKRKSDSKEQSKADRRVSFSATSKTHILAPEKDASSSDSDSDSDGNSDAPSSDGEATPLKKNQSPTPAVKAKKTVGSMDISDDSSSSEDESPKKVKNVEKGLKESKKRSKANDAMEVEFGLLNGGADDDDDDEESAASDYAASKPLVTAKPFRRATFKTDVTSECVLATFPQGQAPDESKSFGFFKTKRTEERVLYSRGEDVEMEGREGDTTSRLRRYLAFRFNPSTGEAILLNSDTKSQCPIPMHNTVSKLPSPNVRTFTHELEDEKNGRTISISQQRRRALIETFGAAKRRKETAAFDLNRINSNAVASGEFVRNVLQEKAKENPAAASNDDEAEAVNRKHLLPPYHNDVERPDQIFNLVEMMTKDELRAMKKPVDTLVKEAQSASAVAAFAESGRFGVFVTAQLERLSSGSLNKKAQKALACAALYLQYLLNFAKLHRVIRPRMAKTLGSLIGDAPQEVADAILEKFSESEGQTGSRLRTKLQQDRLTMHILALALIVCGCVIDSATVLKLAEDFGQTPSWIYDYAAQLGTRLKYESNTKGHDGKKPKKIVLEVPLKFPRKSQARRG